MKIEQCPCNTVVLSETLTHYKHNPPGLIYLKELDIGALEYLKKDTLNDDQITLLINHSVIFHLCRATTKEESLSLPGSRVKLVLSPLRRRQDEPSSSRIDLTESKDESEDEIQIRGGINVLKSIKKRKSERLKNLNPPSTKSLLRLRINNIVCN